MDFSSLLLNISILWRDNSSEQLSCFVLCSPSRYTDTGFVYVLMFVCFVSVPSDDLINEIIDDPDKLNSILRSALEIETC